MKKAFRAAFEDFFASPAHQKFAELLRSYGGEYDNLDYKAEWPGYPKLARHMLAIGNWGGGVLVMGMEQLHDGSLKARGLQNIRDKALIYKGVSKYLPRLFEWEVHDFSFEDGALAGNKFQVILIEYRPQILPLVSEGDGDGIRKGAIYVRRGTSSEEAEYHELQKILNARIETSHSSTRVITLEEHLDELRALYRRIPAHRGLDVLMAERLQLVAGERNPDYPQEDYEQYIAKLIERKNRVIDSVIGRQSAQPEVPSGGRR
jgi:hypothetical protein